MTLTITEVTSAEQAAAAGALTAAVYVDEGHVRAGHAYAAELADPTPRMPHSRLFTALDTDDGTLLGVVTYAVHPSPVAEVARPGEAEIRMLAVSPAARGRGVGAALVRHCMDQARADGIPAMALSTMPEMHAAHRLYERLGFTRAPERDWPIPEGFVLLAYEQDLRRS